MKEILLYNVISNSSFFSESKFINEIVGQIKEAEGEDILLRINSPGGSVFDGYTLISHLSEHDAQVNMKVDGLAASMAGVILAFADNAEASEFSKIMLHKAWSYSENEESIKLLADMNKQFAKIFKKKGVDAKLVDEIFLSDTKKDFWFTPEQAKKMGLISKITKSKIKAAASTNLIDDYYQMFGNIENKIIYNNNEVQEMFDNKEKAELEKKLSELQESFTAKTNEMVALSEEKASLESINATLKSEKDKLDNELAELNKLNAEKEEIEAQAGEVVALAIAELKKADETISSLIAENKMSVEKVAKDVTDLIAKLSESNVTNFVVDEHQEGKEITNLNGLDDEIAKLNEKVK